MNTGFLFFSLMACSDIPRAYDAELSLSQDEAQVGEVVTLTMAGTFEARRNVMELVMWKSVYIDAEDTILESFTVTSAPGADEIEAERFAYDFGTNFAIYRDFRGAIDFTIESEMICSMPGEIEYFSMNYDVIYGDGRSAHGDWIDTPFGFRCVE